MSVILAPAAYRAIAFFSLLLLHLFISKTEAKAHPSNLKHVVQMDRDLETVPQGSLEVESLNIGYNMIEILPEYVFFNNSYKNAKKIILKENCIHTINVHAFKGLRQLKTIDLSSNNITHIDPYSFKSNHKLERLVLNENGISFKRTHTFLISNSVETLVLSKNGITDVYDATFLGLPNLRELVLSENPLTSISSNAFKQLSQLRYLNLANTEVFKLSASMFQVFPKVLNLEDTPLAKTFDPPLKEIVEDAVQTLLELNRKFGS